MRISYVMNPVRWSPWDRRLGGSEQMVVQTAKRLVERGHEVTVYGALTQTGMRDGVRYREPELFDRADVNLNVNWPRATPVMPTVHWTSLWPPQRLDRFPVVLALSDWHARHIDHPDVRVCPPGWDEEPRTHPLPFADPEKLVIYTSSPDRGLDEIVRAWPDVVDLHPGALLVATYGAILETIPNAVGLTLDDRAMNALYQRADVWCHPCTGVELYCLSAVKAQTAGCWPVYYPTMALSETVKYGFRSTPATLALDILDALAVRSRALPLIFPGWEDTTNVLERALQDVAR